MATVLKLIGALVLLGVIALALFISDLIWNDSRLFYMMAGRDGLIRDCRPLAMEKLVGDGFAPSDLVFDPHPSIGFADLSGARSKTFDSAFTFTDGPLGTRVDGHLVCTLSGKSVTVDVDVSSLPHRTT